MNYYPFHVGDYVTHTAHLSPLEDIAYRRLLDLCYITEAPLPLDVTACARLIRMRDNETEVAQVLKEFFAQTDDGWVSERANDEIAAMRVKQEKAKASAAASVAARQAKVKRPLKAKSKPVEPPQSVGLTDVERTLNERSTTVELPTPTPIPNTSVPNGTGGKPPKVTDPDEIIFGYGVPLLTAAGNTDRASRSFLGGLRKNHGDEAVVAALRDCIKAKPLQPLEWLAAALPPSGSNGRSRKAPVPENFDAVDYGVGGLL